MAGSEVRRSDVSALNRALSEEGYLGGVHELSGVASRGLRAAKAAVEAADALRALADIERPAVQLAALLSFLDARERIPPEGDALRERHLRSRSAVRSAIYGLREAHAHLDDTPVPFAEVAAMIRRWIESQTFSPRSGTTGVQLIDAQAARYGEFDEVFLVGLVEGEWPERAAKSIFFPGSLLNQLDWPDSRMALAGERAAFRDLITLAQREVHLSTFELEEDAIVGPSVFLDEADRLGLRGSGARRGSGGPHVPAPGAVVQIRSWLRLRRARRAAGCSFDWDGRRRARANFMGRLRRTSRPRTA